MFGVVVSLFLASFLSIFVCLVAWVLSKRVVLDREKNSPFECGFDPSGSARVPFSMRFFLLAVIFLIFDVELVLLMPFCSFCFLFFSWLSFVGILMFIFVLILGVFHEWNEGSLDWIS